MAKAFGDIVGHLTSKKVKQGSPYHLARGKGGSVIVKANPTPHVQSPVEKAWTFDFA